MKERLTREDGFTLPEMLVTMLLMIVVLFALYNVFDSALRVFSFGNDKVEAVENARLGLERMEREVRAAYAYNEPAGDTHLFDSMTATRITFGNDSGNGDRVIDQSTEEITYSFSSTANAATPCTSVAATPCTLRRTVGTGTAEAVVEYLDYDDNGTPANAADDVPGLQFGYLTDDGVTTATTDTGTTASTDVAIVQITLVVDKDGRRQTLTTNVDLRNRG